MKMPSFIKKTATADLPLFLISLILFAYAFWKSPEILTTSSALLWKMTLGAHLAIFIDRLSFPYARPSSDNPNPNWMHRRALLTAAGMVGGAFTA